ncbi:MAG: hypothetical protein G3M70_10115 [Candidatus Nitronauta litoralis]|uniref:SGNH hydrolase-type esterase domain-containing protein n=1 Tax=Candidatus Nitronauta litoralis TaxID=2705533 RepID=A0A7T0G0U5_9BACT|nr:MAG: hypothetical protein G3M70_10115 [Candidatus Nitronauta litoralis]
MRKILKNILFCLMPLIILFALVEGGLHLSGFQGNRFYSILFGDDRNSPMLFQESPRLWWKLFPNTQVSFLGIETRTDEYGMRIHPSTPVVANKGPRILCLGDSSTFGWRMDYEDTYPYLLEKALQDSLPGVQVFNGGVPGYTSHQNLHQFMQLVDQVEPDYVILYTGNNDVSLAGSNDLQKFKEAESLIGVQEFFNHFLSYQYLKQKLVPVKPFKMLGVLSLEEVLKKPVRVGLPEFTDNLNQFLEVANKKGIPAFIIIAPSNPGAPYLLEIPNGTGKVNELVSSAGKFLKESNYNEVKKVIVRLKELAPDYYRTKFIEGQLLKRQGQKGWLPLFEEALELHPFPSRLKKAYIQSMIDLGKKMQAPVINANEAFKKSPIGLDKLMIDGIHPSKEGNRIISRNVVKAMEKNL